MLGGSFGDVTPKTTYEIIISIIMMLVGAIFYAKIFAEFEKITFMRARESIMRKKMFDQMKEFSVIRKFPLSLKKRVKQFYTKPNSINLEGKLYS